MPASGEKAGAVEREVPEDMVLDAVLSGYDCSLFWQKDYPRIQILRVEDLFNNGRCIRINASITRC